MRFFTTILFCLVALVLVVGCSDNGTAPPTPTERSDRASTMEKISSGHVVYSVNSADDGLSLLNSTTGTVTFIGPLDPDPEQFKTPIAMAIHPDDFTIYVWNNSPVSGLVTVDPCSGLGTAVDPSLGAGPGLSSLAFNDNGDLYGLDNSLFSIDPTTGVSSLVGSLGSGIRAGGADFDPAGVLYVVDLTLTPPVRLATVNTGTGVATVVANLSQDIGTIGSIMFDDSGTLLGSGFQGPQGNILFDIDPADGTVSNIRPVTGGSPPQGMGMAPACGSVEIDIRPGSYPNPINLKSTGVIPVAILGTPTFDVTSIDDSTLLFGPAGAAIAHNNAHLDDVNDDGLYDMVAHFRTQETGIGPEEAEACLTGETFDGFEFFGCDDIIIVSTTRALLHAD